MTIKGIMSYSVVRILKIIICLEICAWRKLGLLIIWWIMKKFPKNLKRKWNTGCINYPVLIGNTEFSKPKLCRQFMGLSDRFISILNIVCYPNMWFFPVMTTIRMNWSLNSLWAPPAFLFSFFPSKPFSQYI